MLSSNLSLRTLYRSTNVGMIGLSSMVRACRWHEAVLVFFVACLLQTGRVQWPLFFPMAASAQKSSLVSHLLSANKHCARVTRTSICRASSRASYYSSGFFCSFASEYESSGVRMASRSCYSTYSYMIRCINTGRGKAAEAFVQLLSYFLYSFLSNSLRSLSFYRILLFCHWLFSRVPSSESKG